MRHRGSRHGPCQRPRHEEQRRREYRWQRPLERLLRQGRGERHPKKSHLNGQRDCHDHAGARALKAGENLFEMPTGHGKSSAERSVRLDTR